MLPRTLKFKVGLYVSAGLMATLVVFTALVVSHQRDELQREAVTRVNQLSETITRSTRFAMLQNQPYYVHRIIEDVGNQKGIDKVRIFNKDGLIIDSTYAREIGQRVDRKAEACVRCHRGEQPVAQIPGNDRSRVFTDATGRRLLGTMDVIRNEPSCYNAGCHVHNKAQTVLGVVDIVYSLEDIDRTMKQSAYTMAGLSLGFVVLAALSVTMFVHRLIYVPLRDLEGGAKRIASGDLEESIPVRSADEFGELATSFNAMTANLRDTQAQLREWGHTLEKKVDERTRQLKLKEREAAQSEKLASVGLLAAGIAHELNNPLTGVLTFSSLIREGMKPGSPEAEDMDLVIRETKRCAGIIRRLLDFARDKAPEKQYADLNQVIEETARLVERPAHLSDIEITLDLDRTLPPVWIDANLVKQVVMNMLVNAQHAIANGGSIRVRTRRSPAPLAPEPGAPAVEMVEIAIVDTGCGIPEQNLKRIFDRSSPRRRSARARGSGSR
jgi:two-component system NtrC family sensor kinase